MSPLVRIAVLAGLGWLVTRPERGLRLCKGARVRILTSPHNGKVGHIICFDGNCQQWKVRVGESATLYRSDNLELLP